MSTLSDCEDHDPEMRDIKKPLLPEFSEADGMMPPPPMTSTNIETMKILLRVRPLKEEEKQEGEDQGCVNVKDSTTLELIPPANSKAYGHGSVKYSYKFNQVYDDFTSQKILFEDGVMETIKQFLDGENCLLFAYGITNSGKTYTMQGPPTDRGVIPRSFDLIFNSIGNKLWHDADLKPWCYTEVKKLSPTELAAADKLKTHIMNSAAKAMGDNSEMYSSCDSLTSQSSVGDALLETLDGDGLALDASQEKLKFSVWVSFAEVYNEQIFDLLAPPSKQKRMTLVLREDRAGNPYIKDLRHVHVTSAEEASKVLTFGQRSLQYACTRLNESSSRSHCIFTLKIVRVADVANPKKAQTSQLSFCDLAGSERSSRTGNEGERLKEASNINKSLLTLGQCVKALRKPGRLVPFRESKLTRLFQAFFTGKGRASMLVNISPAASSFDENVHALKFTSFAKQVPMVTSKPDMPQPTPARTALSLSLEQEASHRATIAWGCDEMVDESEGEKENNGDEHTERSDDEYEDSAAIIEQYRRAVERLKRALIDADEIIRKERREKEKVKRDARKEMMEQISIIEKGYQEQMETHREIQVANSERQMDILATNATKSVRRREQESREELNKVVEEFELKLEDKGREMEEMNKKLQAKGREVEELNRKLEDRQMEEMNKKLQAKGREVEELNRNLEDRNREMEELNRKLEDKDREMEELSKKLEKRDTEMEEMGRKLQERDREVEKLGKMLKRKDSVMERLKNTNTQDDGENLANNEIFIQLTQRLKNTETALQEKEDEVSELLSQLDTLREVSDDKKNKKQSSDTPSMEAGMEEIDKLKSELEEVRAVVMKRDEELRDTQAKLSTAQSQHKTTVKDLELEVLAVSRGLQASDTEKEAAERKVQEMEAQLEAEQVCCSNLQCQTEQMESTITQRTKEYNELVAEMDMLKTTVSQLTTDKEGSKDLQAKCSTLTDNMKKLQDQLRRRSVELHGDMSTVQTDLLACKQELARVKKEREKLQSQLDSSKNDSFQLNSKNISLTNELVEVKEQLSTFIDKHQESEAMVAEQADKLSAQETELLEVTSRKDTLDRELQGLRELIQKSEQQSSVMEATVYQLRKELNEDKMSEREAEDLQQLKDELEASREKNRTLQGELNEKQETQQSLQAQLKEQQETVEKLSAANSLKFDGVRELEKEVEMKSEEVKELKDEVANLQKELDEASRKCQKFSTLETRILDMDRKCDEQSKLYDRATDKITQMTNENLKLREKMAAARKQAELKVEALTEDVASKEKKAESLRVILEARQSEWERKDNSHETVKLKAERMEKENIQLHEELSALSIEVTDLDAKLKDQSYDSQVNEKRLHSQLTAMEEKAAALSDDLKSANEKLAAAEERLDSPTDEHEQIAALKAAVNEQEKTMKMQDEVVEKKEEQISALNKEICEWRLKCQDLCDADLEKISLQSKLTSANNEKKFMQEMQAKMMSQVSMLNDKTTKLNGDNAQLKEENQKLEDRVKSAADDGLMEKERELQALRQEMEEWQANKQVLVEELRQVLAEKDETINKLQSGDETPSIQVEELEKKLAKKEKTILLLENKIQRQESTIQDLVGGSTRTTRGRAGSSTSSMADDREKLQSLQAELDQERRNHEKAQEALERVHFAKDEQVKDLKQANQKLQKEINQLNKRVSTRVSERFKEPSFTNDDELSQSTLELDVTPMSAKKRQRVSRSTRKTSTRQDTSAQKENVSTSRTSTLKRRLQGLVEKSTSPLASPAKKLLQVRVTPLKVSKTNSPDTPADQQAKPATRGRRNLYTVGEQVLSDTPVQESTSSRRSTRSNANIHTNVLRSMRSSRLK